MIVLILCAGEQTRWGDPDRPKQLVDVGGEPLLARLVRQVRGYGHEPVIVTRDPRLRISKRAFDPPFYACTLETFYSTSSLWDKRTIVLLGDVIFTPDAMAHIMCCRDLMRVFGRKKLHFRTVGRYYEIFGLSFAHTVAQDVLANLRRCLDHPSGGKHDGKLRAFYERWCDLPPGQYRHEDEIFYGIEDWTEDIDTPEDYVQFQQMVVERGWLAPASRAQRRIDACPVRS